MGFLLAVLVVFLLLVVSEYWWRRQNLEVEFTRKFVHITVGSFVAFWPYFLTATEIKLLSIAFIIVVVLSKYLHVFSAIHSVQRPTLGELWFALVVGLLAFADGHPHIFTAALLMMSLADGFAAVIGTRYGNSHRYTVMGSPKTLVGTGTFLVISLIILAVYSAMTPGMLPVAVLLALAAGTTILENVATQGLDNLVVPLVTAAVLLMAAGVSI